MARVRFAVFVLSFLVCTSLVAQTTGNLEGKVTDSTGAALPGVTIEAKSPALQGLRAVSTSYDGSYRLVLLPPGDYAVTFRLEASRPRHGGT